MSDPAPAPAARYDWSRFMTPAAILALAAAVLWHGSLLINNAPSPAPAPAGPDGVKVGRDYAPSVVKDFADAWDVCADALSQGKTFADSKKAFQDAWVSGRKSSFTKMVDPSLKTIIPDKGEPDAWQRARAAAFLHDFAKGLRGGR